LPAQKTRENIRISTHKKATLNLKEKRKQGGKRHWWQNTPHWAGIGRQAAKRSVSGHFQEPANSGLQYFYIYLKKNLSCFQ
jgi:hypothetical protein